MRWDSDRLSRMLALLAAASTLGIPNYGSHDFGPCPSAISWEVLQLHHTKLTAMAHFANPERVRDARSTADHLRRTRVLSRLHANSPRADCICCLALVSPILCVPA